MQPYRQVVFCDLSCFFAIGCSKRLWLWELRLWSLSADASTTTMLSETHWSLQLHLWADSNILGQICYMQTSPVLLANGMLQLCYTQGPYQLRFVQSSFLQAYTLNVLKVLCTNHYSILSFTLHPNWKPKLVHVHIRTSPGTTLTSSSPRGTLHSEHIHSAAAMDTQLERSAVPTVLLCTACVLHCAQVTCTP